MRRLAALLLAATCGLAAQDHEVILQLRFDQALQGTNDYAASSGMGTTLGVVLTERKARGLCFQLDGRIAADRFRDDLVRTELNGVGLGFGAKLFFHPKAEGFYLTGALLAEEWGYTARSSQGLESFNATRPSKTLGLGWRLESFEVEAGFQETVVESDLRWNHTYLGFGLQF